MEHIELFLAVSSKIQEDKDEPKKELFTFLAECKGNIKEPELARFKDKTRSYA